MPDSPALGAAPFVPDSDLDGLRSAVRRHGEVIVPDSGDFAGRRVLATTHPAAVLRSRGRDKVYASLLADLRTAVAALARDG